MIKALCARYSASNELLEVRDLCMILLGFSGFLRFDELSSLRCNDISILTAILFLKYERARQTSIDLVTKFQ